jgi:archaellum component FlaC
VAVISVVMNNRILGYKVDELKKQVEKHNQVVENVALLQQETSTQWKRIDELRKDVEDLKKEVK